MFHGTQKVTLTNESVKEALDDYLRKHLSNTIVAKVESWKIDQNTQYNPGGPGVELEFSAESAQGKSS